MVRSKGTPDQKPKTSRRATGVFRPRNASVHATPKAQEILYCHARAGSKRIAPGHWFFDLGAMQLCGETGKRADGSWYLAGVTRLHNQKPHDETLRFGDEQEVLSYVADYFGRTVRRVRVREMPRPEDV